MDTPDRDQWVAHLAALIQTPARWLRTESLRPAEDDTGSPSTFQACSLGLDGVWVDPASGEQSRRREVARLITRRPPCGTRQRCRYRRAGPPTPAPAATTPAGSGEHNTPTTLCWPELVRQQCFVCGCMNAGGPRPSASAFPPGSCTRRRGNSTFPARRCNILSNPSPTAMRPTAHWSSWSRRSKVAAGVQRSAISVSSYVREPDGLIPRRADMAPETYGSKAPQATNGAATAFGDRYEIELFWGIRRPGQARAGNLSVAS